MTRDLILSCVAALLLASCASGPQPAQSPLGAAPSEAATPPPPPLREEPAAAPVQLTPAPADLAAAAKALDAAVHAQADHGFARADGYVYGNDIATLLLYAAQRKDLELYAKLWPYASALVMEDDNDPYTKGFVLWRMRSGGTPGRSDAAAALWMARAFWTSAQAFKRDADRDVALGILDGYAKHAYVLQGVWLARRSFDFPTRGFASVSVLADYQPDFLADAERHSSRGDWHGFAERSYSLLSRAATPSRLLLPVIQPEVGANYPGAGLDLYAPNGIAPLEDSCLGAEGAVAGLPKVAAAVTDFAVDNAKGGKRLRAMYATADGSASGDAALPAAGTACLERLASAIGNNDALAVLDPRLTGELQAAAKGHVPPATAGPLLLAAQARGAL